MILKKGLGILSFTLILFLQIGFVSSNGAPAPCIVEDQIPYENLVLSNEIIRQLNDELGPIESDAIVITDCFDDISKGNFEASMLYKIPKSYSKFRIDYSEIIFISYQNGSFFEVDEKRNLITLNYDNIIEKIINKITLIESNSRIKEFIIRLNTKTGTLYRNEILGANNSSRIIFKFSDELEEVSVTEYRVPNSIELNEFPEVKKFHSMVNCSVMREEYSYTEGYISGDKWSMRTTTYCNDRDYPYLEERALISKDTKVEDVKDTKVDYYSKELESTSIERESVKTDNKSIYWIVGLIIVIILIIVLFLIIKKRRKNKN